MHMMMSQRSMFILGLSLVLTPCVSIAKPVNCRIGGLDFSATGSIIIPGSKQTPTGDHWEIGVCKTANELCPNLKEGFVQSSVCANNQSDTYAQMSSFVLTATGAAFNFSNDNDEIVSFDISCYEDGAINALSLAPSISTTDDAAVRGFELRSKCACKGGCGVPSSPPANPECGIGMVDLSSIQATTFTSSSRGGSNALWEFSPCGVSGVFCPDSPGYLSSQTDAGECSYNTLFTKLMSISELPEDTGVVVTYSSGNDDEGGDNGLATVTMFCNMSAPRFMLTSQSDIATATGYNQNARWSLNFSSKCACANACPPDRDFWSRGPGQRTTKAGIPVPYPPNYPGQLDGKTTIGVGVSLQQCSEACDAVAPKCTAFSYSLPQNGTCLLFESAACTSSTSAGWNWTTHWLVTGTCTPPGDDDHIVEEKEGVVVVASQQRQQQQQQQQHHHQHQQRRTKRKQAIRTDLNDAQCTNTNGSCMTATVIGTINSVPSTALCCTLCYADPLCKAFTLLTNTSACLLQSEAGGTTPDKQCQSGTAGPTPPTPPTPPQPTPPPKPDNCTVGGMHFSALPPVKFSLPYAQDTSPWVPTTWLLSLCSPTPSASGGSYYLHGSPQSTATRFLFSKLENFSVGEAGADFLYSGAQGLARVSVMCDPNSEVAWDLSPRVDEAVVIVNGTAPNLFLHLSTRSRCACPGLCGASAPPSRPSKSCHIDSKNFSTTSPATFSLAANLTDGWKNGNPVSAPVGLRGDTTYTWSISPCQSVSKLCRTPFFMTARANNGSWCSQSIANLDTQTYFSARKDIVEFGLASADKSTRALVTVRCGGAAQVLNVDSSMGFVKVTGAGTKSLLFEVNLTSGCACDGGCVSHPTRPYHTKAIGQSAIDPGEPVEYPSNLPGASTFNGTSCGRGIVENQCAQACDAASAPVCDSFTFTDTGGLCFLYNGGGCDTYATYGKTSYWIPSQCPTQQAQALTMAHSQ